MRRHKDKRGGNARGCCVVVNRMIAHSSRRSFNPAESTRSISQSGKRKEAEDWTLELNRLVSSCSSFSPRSSCLERDGDYNDAWEGCFLFIVFFFSLTRGRTDVRSGVKQQQWTKWTFRAWFTDNISNSTQASFSLLGGAPPPLTLMIVWETFKIKKKKWFIDLNEFIYWLLLYAMLGTMFIFLLTCWIPSWYKLE